jgi:hypothetical protein
MRLLAGGVLFFLPTLSFAKPSVASETVVVIYPVTSGISRPPATPLSRVLILGTQSHPSLAAAIAAAKDIFRRGGITVVDEVPVRSSKENQGPQLRARRDSVVTLRAIGKEAGADHILVLEITDTLVLDKGGQMTNSYLHDERISVRGVGVESGSLVLEGTARWSQPIERAGEHIRELTAYAIGRALCSPDKWEEASARNDGRGRCRR